MTDTTDTSQSSNPATETRTAVIRMVAAAEYFKLAGELPSWARNELQSWNRPDVVGSDGERRRVS